MKRSTGFLLVELSIGLILSTLSLALLIPLLAHISPPSQADHTQLLKAHYDIAHAIRLITPLRNVEEAPNMITIRGINNEIVSISCANGGCTLTKAGKKSTIVPRPEKASFALIKRSDSLFGLSVTLWNKETTLTLIHPLYLV